MTDPRMTTTDAPVTVEQCDREAGLALRLHTTSVRPGDRRYNEICADYRSGKKDASESVQAFARHRLAALASAPAGDGVATAEDAIMAGQAVMRGEGDGTYDEAVAAIEGLVNALAAALARPRAAVGEQSREAMARIIDPGAYIATTHPAFPLMSAGIELRRAEALGKVDAILALQSPPAKVE